MPKKPKVKKINVSAPRTKGNKGVRPGSGPRGFRVPPATTKRKYK